MKLVFFLMWIAIDPTTPEAGMVKEIGVYSSMIECEARRAELESKTLNGKLACVEKKMHSLATRD